MLKTCAFFDLKLKLSTPFRHSFGALMLSDCPFNVIIKDYNSCLSHEKQLTSSYSWYLIVYINYLPKFADFKKLKKKFCKASPLKQAINKSACMLITSIFVSLLAASRYTIYAFTSRFIFRSTYKKSKQGLWQNTVNQVIK